MATRKNYKYKLITDGPEPIFQMEGKNYTMDEVASAINSHERKKAIIRNNSKRKSQEKRAARQAAKNV